MTYSLRSRHILFVASTGLAAAGAWSGCTASAEGDGNVTDAGGNGGGTTDPGNCPTGTRWNGRSCVSTGDPVPDVGPGTDTTDDTGEDATPRECPPSTRYCTDASNYAICDDDGRIASQAACESGEYCADGFCLVGEAPSCEAGQVIRCASPTALLRCADDGVSQVSEPCPASAGNCIAGACTDQICTANARSCQGNNIVQCSDDGRTQQVLETCETGCSAGQCVDPCAGDGKSYVGCGFYAVDLDNYSACSSNADCDPGSTCVQNECSNGGANREQFAVTVSNTSNRTVEVTVDTPDGNVVATRTVAPGALESIPLPQRDVENSSLSFNSYRVQSDGPITVHQFNPQNNSGAFSNDASLLLPATSLGTEYLFLGWPTVASGPNAAALKSQMIIVATSDGTTRVSVTSPIASMPGPGGTPAALVPNTPTEFTLERGQVLSFATERVASADFTGASISSDQPIAVFSAAECANIPLDNQFCDHIEQQLYPVDTWGTNFIGSKFFPRGSEPDVWRIIASQDNTQLRFSRNLSQFDGRVLNRGQILEFATTADFVLGADKPILVGQFMVGSSFPGRANGCDRGPLGNTRNCAMPVDRSCGGSSVGDPAYLLGVPTEQFRRDYIVNVPSDYRRNYLNIIAESGTSIQLDSAPLSATPSNTVGGYDIYRIAVPAGVRRIDATSPVGLYVYGYDCDVSFAYPGGLDLESLR